LEYGRCDYLFSIVDPSILGPSILRLARRSAVNFHDGLLPRYAGVNATSWAILNRERLHGITFHEMRETLDAGPILQQRRVSVECAETAFSLNVKCYEAAIAGFSDLIVAISTNSLSPMPQPLELRSYASKSKRPFAAGTIFFRHAAEELNALVRALDFGPSVNPLCRPKLLLLSNAEVVAVGEIEVLETGFSRTPGVIIAVEDDVLRVATATRNVALGKFETLEGQPTALRDLAGRNASAADKMLPELAPNCAQQLTAFTRAVCCNEEFLGPASCRSGADRIVLPPVFGPCTVEARPGRRSRCGGRCRHG
jgi:methionyl-tRNA formyltransferase